MNKMDKFFYLFLLYLIGSMASSISKEWLTCVIYILCLFDCFIGIQVLLFSACLFYIWTALVIEKWSRGVHNL